MIPGGDHISRSLLLRRVSSWSEVGTRQTSSIDDDTSIASGSASVTDDDDLSRPLLPSLEYEDDSTRSGNSNPFGDDQSRFKPFKWKLWVVFTLLVVSGVGNVIIAKLQSLPMYNYPTFLNMYANLMYIVMSFAYILPTTAFGWFNNSIPRRHLTSMSKKPFFVMGFLDAMSAAMQVLSTVYLPGTLLVLLPQVAIPISMVASSLILREKYSFNQYLGAVVVFGGILVVLFPVLTHRRETDFHCVAVDEESDCIICQMETSKEQCLSHVKKHEPWLVLLADNRTDSDDLYCNWVSKEMIASKEDFLTFVWSIVLVVSCVPMVLSSVYKQVALQVQLDPILVNGWVAVFQFLCGLLMVVPSGLASSPRLHPLDIAGNWRSAMECLFARTNTVESGCHPDDCSKAPLWVHLGLVSSAIYSLSIMFVLKYGSCDLLYLGLTLVVPIGHLAFSLHSVEEISVFDFAGVFVIVAGLIMYRFGYTDELSDVPSPGGNVDDSERLINSTTTTETSNQAATPPETDKGGFLEFLREPFMLIGDI